VGGSDTERDPLGRGAEPTLPTARVPGRARRRRPRRVRSLMSAVRPGRKTWGRFPRTVGERETEQSHTEQGWPPGSARAQEHPRGTKTSACPDHVPPDRQRYGCRNRPERARPFPVSRTVARARRIPRGSQAVRTTARLQSRARGMIHRRASPGAERTQGAAPRAEPPNARSTTGSCRRRDWG